MSNISNNTITTATNTITTATNTTKQFVSNNGKMLFVILFLLSAIIFTIVYLYRFFKKQKKRIKKIRIYIPVTVYLVPIIGQK